MRDSLPESNEFKQKKQDAYSCSSWSNDCPQFNIWIPHVSIGLDVCRLSFKGWCSLYAHDESIYARSVYCHQYFRKFDVMLLLIPITIAITILVDSFHSGFLLLCRLIIAVEMTPLPSHRLMRNQL